MQAQTDHPSEQQLVGFHDFVRATLAAWKVPGAAVAVVKDGAVILSQGFGLRDVEQGLAVTPETLFAIGSCTKAFTATAMGILVDEGKLAWDAPVRTYLPSFTLHDPVATERMTPRDLVTHRSGLPRHDFVWYGSPFTRQELFDRLRYLQPSKDFRAVWQYQNLMYMAAGYLVGQIAGCEWEEFVQRRILQPLGMQNSNFSVRISQESADFALPYLERGDEVRKIPFRTLDSVGPAGSINSGISEMAQWLLLNLNKGACGSTRIISEPSLAQIHTPQMVVQEPIKYTELFPGSYGMGWMIQAYRGHLMLHHGGGIDGFSALTSFLPQDNLGVVVLTNLNGTSVPWILTCHIYDRLLGFAQLPWSERLKKETAEIKEAAEKGKQQQVAERKTGTRLSHPLAEYTGDFAHPGYGVFSVVLEGDGLRAFYNSTSFPLGHYHYDVFELVWELFDQRLKVTFFADAKGNLSSFSVPLEPTVEDIIFTRMPDKHMREKQFLEKFVGTYKVLGLDLVISLKEGDTLVAVVPGQPEYQLIPDRGTTFTFKGLSGFRLEFKLNDAGGVIAAEITQPAGVFTAQRIDE